MKKEINKENGSAKLYIDSKLYSASIVERALKNFLEIIYANLGEEENSIVLEIELKEELKQDDKQNIKEIERIAKELNNSIIEEKIRVEIENETKTIRDSIYKKAMSTK